MSNHLYYKYLDQYSQEKLVDNTVNTTANYTQVIPYNVVIQGSLKVDDQTTHHNLDISASTADTTVLHDHLTITDSNIQHDRPIIVNQQGTSFTDGINIVSGANTWRIYVDSNDDLVFTYNDIVVNKISHD